MWRDLRARRRLKLVAVANTNAQMMSTLIIGLVVMSYPARRYLWFKNFGTEVQPTETHTEKGWL
jgi:hypothetical protein